jgi:GAF domain-containing protein
MKVDDPKIKAARYGMLSEFALLIAQADDLEQLLKKLTNNMKWLLNFQRCTLALRNPDGETYCLRTLAETRKGVPDCSNERIPLQDGLPGAILTTGKPQILHKEEILKGIDNPVDPALWDGSLATIMVLPLQAYGETLGALTLGNYAPDGYDSEDLKVGKTIATHLALAIERWQQMDRLQDANQELTRAGLQRPLQRPPLHRIQ